MSNNASGRRVQFENLTWLGKSVFAGAALAWLTGTLVDATTDRGAAIARESKRAFERELDPSLEEARIVQEVSSRSDPTEQS
ncbi:MAG: hypothetical protein BRD55_07795 [Bacteroidetes bacterium SW_9_63_38]|nr:MAG: hypothetical protein BRD55_07795 [Bacteroidetes bacterium SW_9_63_38]